ncbi:hypothetical protein B1H58_09635 [Pantoea alhagi]|uniref:ImpA N-terminal domain-containing protein n=1 Tax=Pantoea alhagi TaxID=1891675 RepID=A0A1W6B5C7_9GAMM|nr:type VI secretion system ImpA family N-terminal domain-containing protein [Pantoea alhagi]ARJ42247.1 hypothetical protein B1H58_09635 [Pantoea alhagi]
MNHIPGLSCSDYYQHVMQPITEDAPCGESLDYDPAFIMLQSRIQPKLGAEYGSFVEAAEPINWTEIEQSCLALLQKSKDIRLLVILMRCRLRKIGLPALAEGTEVLHALLKTWPDDLHPQLLDEGEFAPILRANAFAELEDINGLLADLRNQPLPRAAGLQISVKEFEKAHQVPREEGALSDATIAALVHEWHLNARDAIRPLTQAHFFLQEIKKILAATLEDEVPELNVLENILAMFSSEFGSTAPAADLSADTLPEIPTQEGLSAPVPHVVPPPVETLPVSCDLPSASPETRKGINNRTDALHRLQEVRSWFAMTEPSSPLIPVLRYAEESIGKNFAELLKMYPPEIVTILSQEKE